MPRLRVILSLFFCLALFASPALAQTPPPQSRPAARPLAPARRLQLQMQRIHQGVVAGKIDAEERQRLARAETAIRARIQALRQRGLPPTAGERVAIRRALNRMNLAIVRAIRSAR